MSRLLLALSGAAVLLGACGRDEAEPAGQDSAAEAEVAAADQPPEPVEPASEPSHPGEDLTATPAADFTGVWAATPELCSQRATWRFTPERLETAGEVSCAIEGAARSQAGWMLQASCTAEGPAAQHEIMLETAASPSGAMTVSGGPFAGPVTLVRCTPPIPGPMTTTPPA